MTGPTAHGAVFEDVGNWKRARYFPQRRRGHARRRAARVPGRAQRRRPVRRQHAGQDRPAGARRRRVPQPRLHQRLDQARGRPLPLRPDAARRRHGVRRRRHRAARPRPLPHDHHDRRRAARAGLARGMAADRMAGAARSTAPRSPSSGRRSPWSARRRARCCARPAPTSTSPTTAFPHLAFREGTVAGIPARVFRISFSGEIAYEVNVPWGYGAALWEALWAAGQPIGITPYGTESHARAARREGLHHRRPGHGRHGDALRSRHGLDRRARPSPTSSASAASPAPAVRAAGRKQLVGLLTGRPGRGAGGGRADRGHAGAAHTAGADDRPRHVELSEPQRSAARSPWRCCGAAMGCTARPSTSRCRAGSSRPR